MNRQQALVTRAAKPLVNQQQGTTILIGADHPTGSLQHPVDSRVPVGKVESRPPLDRNSCGSGSFPGRWPVIPHPR
jgi:hypothetical protein